MSFRSALARKTPSLQPEYVRTPVGGREAVFRFSVPVFRVQDVAETVTWYTRHLGFAAESFPDRAPHEFAILERDGVQILVRRAEDARRTSDGHNGWDLYLWVDGADLGRLEAAMALAGRIVRPLSPLGSTMAELEVRDPNGYVLCIGGPHHVTPTQAS
jgi:catechol 2,3-dioxygenase-like lactoylglutathione lyase family enzyme